ncbi:MAG: MaoC family dehydratase N-terminal domain-containing protein [Acidimicrobiaceae bacterium]|nr:MaoC family dehydratase N-terminal domain-containing protein [Acidimicrobiaceae bacterium]
MAVEKFPIEASHVRMFAYAIGDDNPVYSDAEYARAKGFENILAPPTFATAEIHFDPTSGLRRRKRNSPAPDGPSGSGSGSGSGEGSGGGQTQPQGTGLHAEQHYEYHRPLRVGDVLTKTTLAPRTWEREGRRAGKLHFSEVTSEYRDQNGELVLTARMVGVRTERPVEASS